MESSRRSFLAGVLAAAGSAAASQVSRASASTLAAPYWEARDAETREPLRAIIESANASDIPPSRLNLGAARYALESFSAEKRAAYYRKKEPRFP